MAEPGHPIGGCNLFRRHGIHVIVRGAVLRPRLLSQDLLMSRPLLVAVLVCASASVSAGPGSGAGQCPEMEQEAPEIAAAVAEATRKPAAKPRTTTSSTPQRKPVKTTPMARGEDPTSRLPAPRWHSFLPGMFR